MYGVVLLRGVELVGVVHHGSCGVPGLPETQYGTGASVARIGGDVDFRLGVIVVNDGEAVYACHKSFDVVEHCLVGGVPGREQQVAFLRGERGEDAGMFSQCREEVGDVSRESKESSYVSGGGRLWPVHNAVGLSRVGVYTCSGDYMSKELETRREER